VSGWVEIRVNGRVVRAREDGTVAAALVSAGTWGFRRSVTGQVRGPVCGMGICHECRVTIDGVAHRRACLEPVAEGMEVTVDA
jgi:sarcosine oxidase subunit alpha